jgi:hypothetical protein
MMISSISNNQNYSYAYSASQVAPSANNTIEPQLKTGVSISTTSVIESNKRSQELGPKECKT